MNDFAHDSFLSKEPNYGEVRNEKAEYLLPETIAYFIIFTFFLSQDNKYLSKQGSPLLFLSLTFPLL